MHVHPRPGTDIGALIQAMDAVRTALANTRNNSGHNNWRALYLDWANNSARSLRDKLEPADVRRLIFTDRYWLLASGEQLDVRHMNGTLNAEMDDQDRTFGEAIDILKADRKRWASDDHLVIFDTGVYLNEARFDLMDITQVAGFMAGRIRLVIPLVVADELDNLKLDSRQHVRWRAMHTINEFERLGIGPRVPTEVRPDDLMNQKFKVTAEVLLDEPGHVRRPVNDDEIIDQAVRLKTTTGRSVRLVTFDFGQASRARYVDLDVRRRAHDPGPEPVQRNEDKHRPLG